MKKALIILSTLLLPAAALSQTGAITDFCKQGATVANTSGLTSNNTLQGVIAGCLVTVYATGTTNLATIFADGSSTPLANPFTANTTTGQWIFYAAVNNGYDVVLSGGIPPNTYQNPVTLTDLFPASQITAASTPAPPAFSAQFANSLANAFQGDSQVTINPVTHTFAAPNVVLTGQSGTTPVCPNGPGGALTTTGCTGGAAANPAGPSFAVNFANSGVTNFQGDPSITINPTTHQLNLGSDLPTGSQAASANAAVTTYSVLAYGGVHDAVSVSCSSSSGSPTLTCPSGTFTSAAVGKYVEIFNWSVAPLASTPYVATISTFVDTAHVTINQNFTNASSFGIWWGTDNVPAAIACSQAVLASPSHAGICVWPVGNYILATAPYRMLSTASDSGDYAPPGGSGAVITCTVSGGGINACTISNGGSGYTDSSTLQTSISGGCTNTQLLCGDALVKLTTNSSGSVTGYSILYPGHGFTSSPTVTVIPLGGDGATAHTTLSGGTITTPVVDTGGSGYGPVNWYAMQGTSGCTVIGTQGGTPFVAKGTTTLTAGAVTAMAIVTNTTGCTSPPTIIFSDYACNSAASTVSPVWGQCSNVAPLDPITIPVQIPFSIGVSWKGEVGANSLGVQLISPWDFRTVDNNEYAIFGGKLQAIDITNLTLSGFLGIYTNNNANYANLSGLNFFGAIGMYTGATDLGFRSNNLNFNSIASWVNGGSWHSRVDFPQGNGGFFDALEFSTTISRPPTGYNALASSLDDWFANNFWHPEFSAYSTDFNETCKFPQSPNQRQTGHSLADAHQANTMCVRGISGAGMSIFVRDNRASGAAVSNTLILKQGYRPIFQGDAGGFAAYNWSSEGTTTIAGTGDPYRSATQQEGGIVINDVGSSSGHPASFTGPQWAGTQVNRAIWSIAAQGSPTSSSWTYNNGSIAANPQPSTNPNYTNRINFPQGAAVGGSVSNPSPSIPPGLDIIGNNGNTPTYEGSLTGFGLGGIRFVTTDGTTSLIDILASGSTWRTPFTGTTTINATTGFKVAGAAPSGHYLCGNGTNYVDSATTCATGIVGTFTCASGGTILVNNANFSATSVVSFGIKTVGGTPGPLATTTPVPATSFSVICATGDSSLYNYRIVN